MPKLTKKQQELCNAPLGEYFDAKDANDSWHLFCKACGKGWSLKKSNTHLGNQLHLLNHAYSHEKNAKATGN